MAVVIGFMALAARRAAEGARTRSEAEALVRLDGSSVLDGLRRVLAVRSEDREGGLGAAVRQEANYLRVYLAQIRSKLEPDPASPRYFVTEARMGYRFEPPA